MVPELEFHDCSMQMYSSEDLDLVEKISIKKKACPDFNCAPFRCPAVKMSQA